MSKKTLKGYQGLFLDDKTQEKLVELQEKGLSDIVKDMHITFKFGKTEQYPPELMEKEFTLKIVGYASDGKNSGFQVELPAELSSYYQNQNSPHITVSLGEIDGVKGKAVDTGTLNFEPIEEPIEIPGKLGYFVFGKGKIMDNSIFEEEKKMEDHEVNTIDIAKLGVEIGMESKEQTLPNGKVVKSLVWDQENLLKAVNVIKHLSEEGKPVRITGVAPAWLVSALTHTVHPCPVSLYQPAVGKDIDIPQLAHGEVNPEGEVAFKTTEKGDAVLVEYTMDLPEGITTYDENNLSKVVVPEIAQGKAVYLSGRGPNYLTVAIAEAYAHTNSSVSLFQPGVGYTCSITHSRSKRLGDLTKDPLGKEEIKEQLSAQKKAPTQEQSQDKTVESKEGPAID